MIFYRKNYIKKNLIIFYKFFNSFFAIVNYLIFNKKIDKIRVFYGGALNGNLGGTLVKIQRLNSFFKNKNFNFNILYLLSNSIYLNKFALRFIKNSNIPIIHNQNGVFYQGWFGNGWKKKNEAISFQYHLADYVFYQSNFSKYCSNKFLGIRNGPGEVLFNAVDINQFKPNSKNYKINEKKIKILISGKYQFHLFYSLKFAIDILDILVKKKKINATINFAGFYDNATLLNLKKLAHEKNLLDKIEFSGIYKQSRAHELYNSADLLFYFVHQSNCPNSVIEAMSCGLPILGQNTGGMKEIVSNNSGICLKAKENWIKPQIPNLDHAVKGFYDIIENYSYYSENAINKVQKDHNLKNWINRHREVFKSYL